MRGLEDMGINLFPFSAPERCLERLFVGSRRLRRRLQDPEALVRRLGIGPGMRVVDLGSGAGYLVPSLSRAVGAGGHVYAVDVNREYLRMLHTLVERERLRNVSVLRAPAWSIPAIPSSSVDFVIALYSLHHFERKEASLREASRLLKPGGRLYVQEPLRRSFLGHGTSPQEALRAARAAGLRALELSVGLLQYRALFEKR
jgi:ubiquinone/menaquinone biosynthesis C-methylase UbiE